MYSTCLFCSRSLGANETIEALPIGRRLAFDATRGRVWVVCVACTRWNLVPLEERWEAIEQCERTFRGTRVRVSTDNIGLARLRDGLELVRIGAPLLPEFAAWRYGARFRRRRQYATWAVGTAGVAGAVALPAVAPAIPAFLGAAAMLSVLTGPVVTPYVGTLYYHMKEHFQVERIVATMRSAEGTLLTIRAKHLKETHLDVPTADSSPTLRLAHDGGVARLEGQRALTSAGILLSRANWLGASPGQVQDAVDRIDQAGSARRFLARVSQLSSRGHRPFAEFRRLAALNLSPVERLAIEMAVHEESERRALEGELGALEEAWKSAEEIAAIADAL